MNSLIGALPIQMFGEAAAGLISEEAVGYGIRTMRYEHLTRYEIEEALVGYCDVNIKTAEKIALRYLEARPRLVLWESRG